MHDAVGTDARAVRCLVNGQRQLTRWLPAVVVRQAVAHARVAAGAAGVPSRARADILLLLD
jgi:hypothetical protein